MGEDQALERLSAILARPEYQFDAREPWWAQLRDAVVSTVYDLLTQLVRNIEALSSGRTGGLGLVAFVVALVVLVALGVYLVRSIRLAVGREAAVRAATMAERRERSDRLWLQAQQQAAAGDWAAAARAAYLSALYALDEHAVLHVESGLTNREHALRLNREHPELAASFAELVVLYDRLRYGGVPITATSFADLRSLVQRARSTSMVGAAA